MRLPANANAADRPQRAKALSGNQQVDGDNQELQRLHR